MAFGTRFVPAFASAAPLSLGGVRRAECSQKGVATATRRAVPVATMPAAIGKASAGTCSLLLAIAVGVLSAIPASAAALDDGQAIFEKSCAACHAGGGNIIGFSRGKTLKASALAKYGYNSPEAVAGLVRSGKGVMPGYDVGQLSDADVSAVSKFVISAAERGWK
uniref:Cytochrome c n=1 Tax=Pyropia haitanensis TaxID=1262161 RepID=A0A0Y0HDX2_PYRHA|nr:cytochrome c [Neoporphyra haitanensis]